MHPEGHQPCGYTKKSPACLGYENGGDMATNMHQLLKIMIEGSATDLHISAGSPPRMRIDGKLKPLDNPDLTSQETKQMCYSILTDNQRRKFEEEDELDLSFGIKGLCRFRVNIFLQRGAVAGAFRAIPYNIQSFQSSWAASGR